MKFWMMSSQAVERWMLQLSNYTERDKLRSGKASVSESRTLFSSVECRALMHRERMANKASGKNCAMLSGRSQAASNMKSKPNATAIVTANCDQGRIP
jgi:hypothetical protein